MANEILSSNSDLEGVDQPTSIDVVSQPKGHHKCTSGQVSNVETQTRKSNFFPTEKGAQIKPALIRSLDIPCVTLDPSSLG